MSQNGSRHAQPAVLKVVSPGSRSVSCSLLATPDAGGAPVYPLPRLQPTEASLLTLNWVWVFPESLPWPTRLWLQIAPPAARQLRSARAHLMPLQHLIGRHSCCVAQATGAAAPIAARASRVWRRLRTSFKASFNVLKDISISSACSQGSFKPHRN